jgi:hypothetical protein
MEKTTQLAVTAAAPRRCPAFPNVPVMLAASIAVALVLVIAFSVTMVVTGHPADSASGIIWAKH